MMARANPLLLAAWLLLTVVLYVWPLDMQLAPVFHTNDASWSDAGVRFSQNGLLRTDTPPRALHDRLLAGDGVTVEAWVTPAPGTQTGPARIVTYSSGADARNFTLGEDRGSLVFRLRAGPGDPNGLADEVTVPGVFAPREARHVAVVYDLAAIEVFVDGERRARFDGHPGSLDAWDPGHDLAVGNELTGDRPWRGTIAAVLIDAGARTPDEIRADFEGGPRAVEDATAVYDFTRGPAGAVGAANLVRPFVYLHGVYPDLLTGHARRFEDFVFNFGIFAVMGWLAAATTGGRRGLGARALLVAVPFVVVAAVAVESLQVYVDGRTSSLRDLLAAIAGGLAGIAVRGAWLSRRTG